VIYDISHVTTYSYEASVASTRCAIRLTPRGGKGQRVLRSRVEAAPAPELMRESMDFFGNRVIEATIREAHARLRISLSARVAVKREAPPAPGLTPAWETIARAAAGLRTLGRDSPIHCVFPSRQAPLYAPATDYARESFPAGRPVLEGAEELSRRIKEDFAYAPHATHVATPLAEAFDARGGVCQDFAHIMIAGLRGLGLPAAYVSGYIRTLPAPGQPRLEGADASHAWVAVWCGEAFGWIHLDPTNAMYVDDNHIVVALGRDYADVSPIDGVIVGSGRQALGVSVDIKAVGERK
jgi:transglutaminase-like putative cysteine protease